MRRKLAIPAGSWPALLPEEMAAAYTGCRSVDAFLREVDENQWPEPYIKYGRGKGLIRKWRKTDLDKKIHPEMALENPVAL